MEKSILMFVMVFCILLLLLSGIVNARIYTCNSCSDCNEKINLASSEDTVKLTEDINDYKRECIYLNSTNILFDCQKHKIDGVDKWWTYGIYILHKGNNTIKNCIIADFFDGIYLGSSGNVITDNIINSNERLGINVHSSSNNKIVNNILSLNEENGISLTYSSQILIANTTVTSNEGAGISLDSSSRNIIVNNTANSNWNGISLRQRSNSNLIENNVANLNEVAGISLGFSSNYNLLTKNFANLNDYGISLSDPSSNNTLSYNELDSNRYYGIYLEGVSNNTLEHNSGKYNKEAGLYFGQMFYSASMKVPSRNNVARYNKFCYNTIDIKDIDKNIGSHNTCDKNSNWNDRGIRGCTYICPKIYTTTTISRSTKALHKRTTTPILKKSGKEGINNLTDGLGIFIVVILAIVIILLFIFYKKSKQKKEGMERARKRI